MKQIQDEAVPAKLVHISQDSKFLHDIKFITFI